MKGNWKLKSCRDYQNVRTNMKMSVNLQKKRFNQPNKGANQKGLY